MDLIINVMSRYQRQNQVCQEYSQHRYSPQEVQISRFLIGCCTDHRLHPYLPKRARPGDIGRSDGRHEAYAYE
jgi:carbonic anhydrase